jgi:peptidoglycan/LPS O-acetylase OafA/YrhL
MTLVLTSHFRPWFAVAFPVAGGYCLLWLAYAPKLPLAKWTSKTDMSYGTYLYACPIQQILISCMTTYTVLHWPLVNFILALPLTLAIAFTSWTLIEKPCLSLKRFYRKNQREPAENPNEPLGGCLRVACEDVYKRVT